MKFVVLKLKLSVGTIDLRAVNIVNDSRIGVVLSHNNLIAQINSQVEAWEWQARDVLLHVLPLHHIHGIVNAVMCPLSVGAK